jgi:hypothetical protein
MTAAEWEPINPCKGCNFNPIMHGLRGVCSSTELKDSCFGYERYKSAVEYQQKLLKYLKLFKCGDKEDMAHGWIMIPPYEYAKMLKESEEGK